MTPGYPPSPSDTPSFGRKHEQHGLPDRARPTQGESPNFPSDRRFRNDGDLTHDGLEILESQDAERVSLLRPGLSKRPSPATYAAGDEDGRDPRRTLPGAPSVLAITIAASALILILDVVASVPTAPRMVIFEDIICRNHYASLQDGGGGGAVDCKIEPVQSELAIINGWKETFDTIPGTCGIVLHPAMPLPVAPSYGLINLPHLGQKAEVI